MNRHKNCILFASFQPDNLCIVRLDKLALNDVLQEKLKATEWGLIVVGPSRNLTSRSAARRDTMDRDSYGLMRPFLTFLKDYQQWSGFHEMELLLHLFLKRGEQGKYASEKERRLFVKACKELADAEAFSLVVRFMYYVFLHPDEYDTALLGKLLSEIQITEEKNAADFCAEVFLMAKSMDAVERWKREKSIPTEDYLQIDLYREEYKNLINLQYCDMPSITQCIPLCMVRLLYGMDLQLDENGAIELTREKLDQVAQRVQERARLRIRRQVKSCKQKNRRIEKEFREMLRQLPPDDRASMPVPPKQVAPKLTAFEEDRGLLGAMMELYCACEACGKVELCQYIMGTYIWPTLWKTPWDADRLPEVRLIGALLSRYDSFMMSEYLSRDPALSLHMVGERKEAFFNELVGYSDSMFLREGRKKYSHLLPMAEDMAEVMHRGRQVLRTHMAVECRSFLYLLTPYLLFCGGKEEEAALFLHEHYDELRMWDRRTLIAQLLLTRSILATKDISVANALYGYYNTEMDRYRKDAPELCRAAQSMAQFLEKAMEYVRERHECTMEDGRSSKSVPAIPSTAERPFFPGRFAAGAAAAGTARRSGTATTSTAE